MDIEKLKNDIALKHGYQDGILGSAWNFAMQLTHRTKRQIALYEEVIEALANSSDENSGLHKPVTMPKGTVCRTVPFEFLQTFQANCMVTVGLNRRFNAVLARVTCRF